MKQNAKPSHLFGCVVCSVSGIGVLLYSEFYDIGIVISLIGIGIMFLGFIGLIMTGILGLSSENTLQHDSHGEPN